MVTATASPTNRRVTKSNDLAAALLRRQSTPGSQPDRSSIRSERRPLLGLRKIRESRQLTQLQLARAAFCDVLTISRWEREKNLPTPSSLNRLARVLQVTPEQLMDPNPVLEPRVPVAPEHLPSAV